MSISRIRTARNGATTAEWALGLLLPEVRRGAEESHLAESRSAVALAADFAELVAEAGVAAAAR
jgi:hypothetical protein